MPELPEVETIRRYLTKDLTGKTIKKIDVLVKKQFIGNPKILEGKKIKEVIRFGKVLSLKFSDSLYLSVHLKLTGQLLVGKNNILYKKNIPHLNTNKLPAKTTHIIIYFTDKTILYFNDLRKFGWMKVVSTPEKPKGIDVLSKNFTQKYFTDQTDSTDKLIKLLLMDQDKLAGIGNIYANDALFLAKIHPLRKSKSLSSQEINRLFAAIKQVIKDGLKYNGASDESYVLPDASLGRYQNHFQVYGRENESCRICKTPIIRIKHGGRSSFFCPICQKL